MNLNKKRKTLLNLWRIWNERMSGWRMNGLNLHLLFAFSSFERNNGKMNNWETEEEEYYQKPKKNWQLLNIFASFFVAWFIQCVKQLN